MFVDLTEPERQRFIKQTCGSHIPGYTGHCPTLKFRYGKRYGANTKELLEELRDISPICKDPPYRHDDCNAALIRCTTKQKDVLGDNKALVNLKQRPYVLGYTGYIPGLNFEYGSSFSHLADRCVVDFLSRLSEEERRREKERMEFINTKPHLVSIRGKDEVTSALQHYSKTNRVPENINICPELPPIAGYTGHIPRIKGTESSLSQTYHSAAQSGLVQLKEEREKRRNLELAKSAVRDAIAYSHVH